MDNKMGRKLNVEELEQVSGGIDPHLNVTNYYTDEELMERCHEYMGGDIWSHTPSCISDPASFVARMVQLDEANQIREELAKGKDFISI